MTRINIIPPKELMDQHLIAEYRETRLLTALMRRMFNSKSGMDKSKIPSRFTLNKGHVTFFKDKGLYINNRYQELQAEMATRGFTAAFQTIDISVWPSGYYNDWTPSKPEQDIVRERIALRISQKPGWYRYYGKPI